MPHRRSNRTPLVGPPPLPARLSDVPRALPPLGDEPAPHHLRHYLGVLWRNRRLAGGVFLAVLALTALVTLLQPRRWTATTRLQIARRGPIELRLEDNVRRLDEGERTRNDVDVFLGTQIATLQSRDLAERVIRTYDLARNGTLRHAGRHAPASLAGVQPELLPRGWRDQDGAPPASTPDAGTPAADGAQPVDPRQVERYVRYLGVSEVRGTDLIDVSFTTPGPALSAFLAAAHAQAYLEMNEDARRATDNLANRFLDRQLARARERVGVAEAALDQFASGHPQVAVNQEHQTVANRIGEVSSLLTKAEAERSALESRFEFLRRGGQGTAAFFLDRPGVQKLRLALLDVQADRTALSERLGQNHPRMLELNRLRAELARQLDAEVAQGVNAVKAKWEAARLREQRLREKVAELERTGTELRSLGARYDLLRNDLETARNQHASLLRQRADTGVNAELAASNIRVVERAEVPIWPSRPKILLNLTLGLFTGLVLAVGAALGRDYFDASVHSSHDVEEALGLPALAVIPHFDDARHGVPEEARRRVLPLSPSARAERSAVRSSAGELAVLREPWSAVAEAFRGMRTAVVFSGAAPDARVVLVTSAVCAEGKTVASLNLATALAEAGARVLLLDADMRHPRCHAALGVANDCGLSTVLAGVEPVEAAIQQLQAPRIAFVPAGPPPPNPAELVSSPRLAATLGVLRDAFEFVVVDSPPVLPVSDAVILARHADGVILTVRGGETSRALAARARDRLRQAGARLMGVVVNAVRPGWDQVVPPYAYRYAGGEPTAAPGRSA